ncbi:hypothetical protein [Shewanella pneumatophori]|uniref:Uncharacterized protein n=1 Tax=Shewanella pneumatophori TaxID=314092 RepID=A0A9X1ZJ86_9GAMM|nr:hypothetical protein [Shewanella pneumatophori]MCL1140887.1 hypothetical protein [Shewanella pneumatophori]
MTIIPLKDRKSRIDDMSKMILPEMAPDQLKLLGISVQDIAEGNSHDAYQNDASGIELIRLVRRRAKAIKTKQNDLYADRSSINQPSQLDLVLDNCDVFKLLIQKLWKILPPDEPYNWPVYQLLYQLFFNIFHIAYPAGSNDTCALLDRYTDSGYKSIVSTPKKAGDTNANKTKSIKHLVISMANHIYQHEHLIAAPKILLAEAIHTRITNFSKEGDNMNIDVLTKFVERKPAESSIGSWLKPIKKPKNSDKLPKPSLHRLVNELEIAFKNQKINKHLSIQPS